MADRDEVSRGLLRSYLFEGMTAEQIEPLAGVALARRLVRGEYVWHAGDPADELYVVLSGEVKDCIVDIDGNEVIHFVHGPGMTFGEPGFFAQERYRILDSVAMTPVTLIRLARSDLWPFLEQHGAVKDRVLEALASDLRFQTNLISSLLTRPLAQRLVLRLLELIDSSPERQSGRPVTPKITQSALAAMIGVTRENVNRALAALALDGSIRLEGCRYVLVDEERLRREVAQGWPLGLCRDRRAAILAARPARKWRAGSLYGPPAHGRPRSLSAARRPGNDAGVRSRTGAASRNAAATPCSRASISISARRSRCGMRRPNVPAVPCR